MVCAAGLSQDHLQLGGTGGIAAYKVALVVRRLKEDGHSVRVVPTEASLHFVGRATWEALEAQIAALDKALSESEQRGNQ